MSLCEQCANAQFRGYPPKGSPEWEVGTVYFWCDARQSHEQLQRCRDFEHGAVSRFDKMGRLM